MENVNKVYNVIGSKLEYKKKQLQLVKSLELAVNENLVKSMVIMTQNEYGFIPTRILLKSSEENLSQSIEEVAVSLVKSTCDFIKKYRTLLDNKETAAKLMSDIIGAIESVIEGEDND